MKQQVKKTSIQLAKYGVVGASNSLITLMVIFVCNDILGMNLYVSNIIGYVLGLINSFIWNKKWVFKTKNPKIKREMLLFLIGFGICYSLQLVTLWAIVAFTSIKELSIVGIPAPQFGECFAICVGMVVYTMCNYAYNRFVTFKPKA